MRPENSTGTVGSQNGRSVASFRWVNTAEKIALSLMTTLRAVLAASHREIRVSLLSLVIFATGIVDCGVTIFQMWTVGMFESNFIITSLLRLTGASGCSAAALVAIFKLLAMAVGLAAVRRGRKLWLAEIGALFCAATYLYVIYVWTQYLDVTLYAWDDGIWGSPVIDWVKIH